MISIVKDSYLSEASSLYSKNILSKYDLGLEGIDIFSEKIDEIVEKIKEQDSSIEVYEFSISSDNDYVVLESLNLYVIIDRYNNKTKASVSFYSKGSYKQLYAIYDIISDYKDSSSEVYVDIHSYFAEPNGNISSNTIVKKINDFKVSEIFYPYLDVNEMFSQYNHSKENIFVLSGEPGTGKTKLGDLYMHYLLEKIHNISTKKNADLTDKDKEISKMGILDNNIKVAYVKNENILSKDIFWNMIYNGEYDIIFLDDLDYYLLPRTQNISTNEDVEKNKFISNLLSFTDGILEKEKNTKIIITTNRPIIDIDEAILRKGRTFDILKLRQLKKEEALKIWLDSGFTKEEFEKENFNENVLQANLGSIIYMKKIEKEKHLEFKSYVKEEGIRVNIKSSQSKIKI